MGTVAAPNIPLDVALGQQAFENSLTEYDRAAQLKAQTAEMQQQQQLNAQQIEMQKRQLADQDALTKAMTAYNSSQHTPDDIPALIVQNGGSGQAALAAQQHILQLKDTASQIAQRDAATGSTQLDTMMKGHDAIAGRLQSASSVPDEQLADALASAVSQGMQQKWLDPDEFQHGQQLVALARQNPQAARQQLPAYVNSFKSENQILKEEQSKAEANANNAKAANENAQAQLNQIKVNLAKNSKPGDFDAQIDSIYDPNGLQSGGQNRMMKAQINAALSRGDVDGAKKYIDQALENQLSTQKEISVATNPAVQQGKINVAAAEGAARANTQIGAERTKTSDAQFQTAMGADERLNRMENSYKDAVNGNQQAMLALLSDHIGMTMGLQKGARITKDLIHEAQQSQPWLASIGAKFDKDGYLTGVTLSKNQMKQMLDLGYSARENAWKNANDSAQLYGVKPPPNAQAVYAKRDPNYRAYNQAGKTIPMSAIQQAARDHGVSVDEAKRQAIAQGYTIQ